jgi:stress-induced morphogen
MNADMIESKIKESMTDAKVKAKDLTGGGDHWQVTVESSSFSGKSLIEQHQLVYKALGDWMKKEIHALALTTKAI